MKIVAKRCPSCGADLDFAYGERDVECKACRHKYAIEYEDGHVQVLPPEHESGFGVSMQEAMDAMEQFSRALRGGYPQQTSQPGVMARCLKIGVPEFNTLFTARGLTQEMIMKEFPKLRVEYDANAHAYIFIELYETVEPAVPELCVQEQDMLTKLNAMLEEMKEEE